MNTLSSRWSSYFLFEGGRRFLVAVLLCLIGSSVLGALTPKMISKLAESYSVESDFYTSLKQLAFLFGGVYLNRVFYQLSINKYIQQLMQNTRSICFEKWLHAYDVKTSKDSRSERYPQGEVISRIMNDTESLRELMTSGTFGIFIDVFFVVSCLISFISLNKVSGIALSLAEVVAALLLIWGSRYMREVFMDVRKSRADMSRLLSNMVGGIKETYYTRHENYASRRGEVVFKDFLTKQLTANIWDAGYYSTAESLYPILLAFIVFLFPYSHITEAAIIFAIVDLIQRSIGPVKDVAAKIANIQRAYTGIQRIDEFLGDLDEALSSKGYQTRGNIELTEAIIDVQFFEYPRKASQDEETAFSLKDIKFSARPGELVGIVGLSGCGKSTLLNMMAANIIPLRGGIHFKSESETLSFPGESAQDLIGYREQVGIVSQESHIFSDSVAFNISMNRETPSDLNEFWEKVREQIPYVRNWNLSLEDKLDQRSLSMGQKQLLAAIRSCYLKKPVVLFDEISSGLDGELELALREMVQLIQRNSLTFVVAHRLETVIGADNIIVLEEGRLRDSGSHAELLENSPVYQEFLQELSQHHSPSKEA
ncbi:MAG: ABC transporter ATP-binding protein [Bdellovibrionota bacterium]|nr:ABC transporter ATP-binding protein [Bdellovibrionota bacterium]